MQEFIKKLKQHIQDKKDNFVVADQWNGDTKTGFYTAYEFDMNQLLAEIDIFSNEFQNLEKD